MMQPPHDSDLSRETLESDHDLTERVRSLLTGALRRQIWLMFLDHEARQLPVIMPSDVPRRPRDGEAVGFGRFLGSVVDELEATTAVITFERRGSDTYDESDREWFRLIRDACSSSGIALRGPLLCHTEGVRWVSPEDYAIE